MKERNGMDHQYSFIQVFHCIRCGYEIKTIQWFHKDLRTMIDF
jgi:hypothetical protein